jgi:hypothetical protein
MIGGRCRNTLNGEGVLLRLRGMLLSLSKGAPLKGIIDWLQFSLFPVLEPVVAICIAAWVFICLPASFFRKARPWVGVALLYGSLITGFACWILSVILTYRTLGIFWLIWGLVLGGVGVLPIALIGLVCRGLWSSIPDLLFAIATALLPRILGIWLVGESERHDVAEEAAAGD